MSEIIGKQSGADLPKGNATRIPTKRRENGLAVLLDSAVSFIFEMEREDLSQD